MSDDRKSWFWDWFKCFQFDVLQSSILAASSTIALEVSCAATSQPQQYPAFTAVLQGQTWQP
jgi:hypothetical protein